MSFDAIALEALAKRDKLQFERWVLRKVQAVRRRKHDRGIDGESFYESEDKTYHVLISVKGGANVTPAFVRELRGTLEREGADVGVLISLVEPTKEMRREATQAKFLPRVDDAGPLPRIQIVTVAQLFTEAKPIRVPGRNKTKTPKKSIPPMTPRTGSATAYRPHGTRS